MMSWWIWEENGLGNAWDLYSIITRRREETW